DTPVIQDLKNYITNFPQAGYEITSDMKKAEIIVLASHFKNEPLLTKKFIEYLKQDKIIIDSTRFYEQLFARTPLSDLNETWFFENFVHRSKFHFFVKRVFDLVSAIILFIIFLPVMLIIAILIKLDSDGPVIYQQIRVGKNGKEFVLYKFRTMIKDAEKFGIKRNNLDDTRVTKIGKILRKTHLDELPQLVNIIKGDLSFVGPRPERPVFVNEYNYSVPFYSIRHIIKPGLTGWAQINYPHGLTLQDAYQKLEYDIFYIKNQSFIFDLLIILKTINHFFS
ncbi:MAG: sugar transferase, partial [Minisyncoccia bacterium]